MCNAKVIIYSCVPKATKPSIPKLVVVSPMGINENVYNIVNNYNTYNSIKDRLKKEYLLGLINHQYLFIEILIM